MPKLTRYALWSLLIIAPTMIVLPALFMTLADAHRPLGADTGPMTAVLSIMALMISAFVAPAIVLPDTNRFPAWTGIVGAVGIAQLLGILFGYGSVTPDSAMFAAYVPGTLAVLNLTALILIHVWVAGRGMGFSPAIGLATGGVYSLWLLRICASHGLDAFMGVSLVGLVLAFVAGIVTVFVASAYGVEPVPEDHGRA